MLSSTSHILKDIFHNFPYSQVLNLYLLCHKTVELRQHKTIIHTPQSIVNFWTKLTKNGLLHSYSCWFSWCFTRTFWGILTFKQNTIKRSRTLYGLLRNCSRWLGQNISSDTTKGIISSYNEERLLRINFLKLKHFKLKTNCVD